MAPGGIGQTYVPGVKKPENSFRSNRLTREMRSQLPLCQPAPERAMAVWAQFFACPKSPRTLPLADTPASVSAPGASAPKALPPRLSAARLPAGRPMASGKTAAPFAADMKTVALGALDCPVSILTSARIEASLAASGKPDGFAAGIIEQTRATPADPARAERVRRIHNGNAHAHRCAPPGRNAGGGTQGKSH